MSPFPSIPLPILLAAPLLFSRLTCGHRGWVERDPSVLEEPRFRLSTKEELCSRLSFLDGQHQRQKWLPHLLKMSPPAAEGRFHASAVDIFAHLYYTKYRTGGSPFWRGLYPNDLNMRWLEKVITNTDDKDDKKCEISKELFFAFIDEGTDSRDKAWDWLESVGPLFEEVVPRLYFLIGEGDPKKGEMFVDACRHKESWKPKYDKMG